MYTHDEQQVHIMGFPLSPRPNGLYSNIENCTCNSGLVKTAAEEQVRVENVDSASLVAHEILNQASSTEINLKKRKMSHQKKCHSFKKMKQLLPRTFGQLPSEMIGNIVSMADKEDLFQLLQVNKEMHELSREYIAKDIASEAVLKDYRIYDDLSRETQKCPEVLLNALAANPLYIRHPTVEYVVTTSQDKRLTDSIIGTVVAAVSFIVSQKILKDPGVNGYLKEMPVFEENLGKVCGNLDLEVEVRNLKKSGLIGELITLNQVRKSNVSKGFIASILESLNELLTASCNHLMFSLVFRVMSCPLSRIYLQKDSSVSMTQASLVIEKARNKILEKVFVLNEALFKKVAVDKEGFILFCCKESNEDFICNNFYLHSFLSFIGVENEDMVLKSLAEKRREVIGWQPSLAKISLLNKVYEPVSFYRSLSEEVRGNYDLALLALKLADESKKRELYTYFPQKLMLNKAFVREANTICVYPEQKENSL